MTSYNLTPRITPSLAAQEKKAARKKLLEEVRKRRIQNAQNRLKHQKSAYTNNSDYHEYQDMLKDEDRLYR